MRVHIGHHFFGSGNFGDDLMLAGFLRAVQGAPSAITFTCCTPFDRDAMRRRFPAVEWLEYEPRRRAHAIAACDTWIGVGDSPFQTVVGPWFLEHLAEEVAFCRRSRKPMLFFGIGVNDRAALAHPHTRTIVESAEHIWTRDAQSAELLAECCHPEKLSVAADLAHVVMDRWAPAASERGVLAFLVNFEACSAFRPEALNEVLEAGRTWQARWWVQEVRVLPGSEQDLYQRLREAERARLDVRISDYGRASLAEFISGWGRPEVVVSSRYHGALVAAWLGCRVLAIERNDKVAGLVSQLGLSSVQRFDRGVPIIEGIRSCGSVPRARLLQLAQCIQAAGRELCTRWLGLSADVLPLDRGAQIP